VTLHFHYDALHCYGSGLVLPRTFCFMIQKCILYSEVNNIGIFRRLKHDNPITSCKKDTSPPAIRKHKVLFSGWEVSVCTSGLQVPTVPPILSKQFRCCFFTFGCKMAVKASHNLLNVTAKWRSLLFRNREVPNSDLGRLSFSMSFFLLSRKEC
jgi:hypothetical protein